MQAISRSGTNNLDGSVYGYFRDDKLNSKDFIANRVLPYANQQLGAAVGGPIVRDKLHYFLSYERENEPNTIIASSAALPGSRWSFPSKLVQNSFLSRADWQIAPRDHVTTRISYWDWGNPFTQVAGTEHPSQAADRSRRAFNVANTWSKVLTDSTIQEVRIGYSHFDWKNKLAIDKLANTPNYVFPGLTVGQRRNYPQEFFQNTISARYDITSSRGQHDLKAGFEVPALARHGVVAAPLARGVTSSAPTRPTWRAGSPLTPMTTRPGGTSRASTRSCRASTRTSATGPSTFRARRSACGWATPGRSTTPLTINGGLRWDADFGALDPPHITTQVTFTPRAGVTTPDTALSSGDKLYPGGLRDINNFAPRGGFTWNVGGKGTSSCAAAAGCTSASPTRTRPSVTSRSTASASW